MTDAHGCRECHTLAMAEAAREEDGMGPAPAEEVELFETLDWIAEMESRHVDHGLDWYREEVLWAAW